MSMRERTIGSIFHLWFQTRVAMSIMAGSLAFVEGMRRGGRCLARGGEAAALGVEVRGAHGGRVASASGCGWPSVAARAVFAERVGGARPCRGRRGRGRGAVMVGELGGVGDGAGLRECRAAMASQAAASRET